MELRQSSMVPTRLSSERISSGAKRGTSKAQETRQICYGLEVPQTLCWQHWQPGKEYSKTFTIRNVSATVKKASYQLTQMKVFSLEFPEVIRLNPGMSYALKVVFRPMRLQPYMDVIDIICEDGVIHLPLQALLPEISLQVPSNLDFAYVPTKEIANRSFTVRNTGDSKVSFQWKLDAPFSLVPLQASLGPGESMQCTITLNPPDAAAFSSTAVCTLQTGETLFMEVQGIGKIPYLSLEAPSIDFGSVTLGTTAEATLRFGNHSSVTANFSVTIDMNHTSKELPVFQVTPSRGTLGPNEYSLLKVLFTPRFMETFSCYTITLATPGGNRISCQVKGESAAPRVRLSTRCFNFGNVLVGQTPSRVLYVENTSEVPVLFEFKIDPSALFTFSPQQGSLPPLSTRHVTITFRGNMPMMYWKRVICMIQDGAPQGVDLLATCYTDQSRPPPLHYHHVVAYMKRWEQGAGPLANLDSPEDVSGSGPMSLMGKSLSGLLGPSPDLPAAIDTLPGPDHWDLYWGGQDPVEAVRIQPSEIDFGSCSHMGRSEPRTFTLVNNLDCKLLTLVHLPEPVRPPGSSSSSRPLLEVHPGQLVEIGPRDQASFTVSFLPDRDGLYHCQELQVCSVVKLMRSFRLLTDQQVVPPWTVGVMVHANSFASKSPEYSPRVLLSHSSVQFAPCCLGQSVHQILTLTNQGDTTVHYQMDRLLVEGQVEVKPHQGVVPPHSNVMVALRFRPSSLQPVRSKLRCTFNHSKLNACEVVVMGKAHAPRLVVKPSGTCFFRPTCVGASTQRTLVLHNPSAVPVAYCWRVSRKVEGVMSVEPSAGVLRGNEMAEITWTFAPSRQQVYDSRASCCFLDPSLLPRELLNLVKGPSGFARPGLLEGIPLLDVKHLEAAAGANKLITHFVGEGTAGALSLSPCDVDLGALKVGYPLRHTVTLTNQSDGVVCYGCRIDEVQEEPEPDTHKRGTHALDFTVLKGLASPSFTSPPEKDQHQEYWVEEPEGVLSARSQRRVTLVLFPRYRGAYHLRLTCWPTAGSGVHPRLSSSGNASNDVPHTYGEGAGTICSVSFYATFPTLMVTDILREDVSKAVAWEMMGVCQINRELQEEVTPVEMTLSKMEEKGTLTSTEAASALSPITMEFGSHAAGSSPVHCTLYLSNQQKLPVHWEVHSYEAPEVELENWVEPSRPRNAEEQLRDFIVQHRVFTINTRSGKLAPGEGAQITITYAPLALGTHILPLLLHIKDGKRLHLQLVGHCVEHVVPCPLDLPSIRHFVLEPVPLGELQPPLQVQVLRNGGPGPLKYTLDLAPLSALKQQNYNFEILRLASSNASGEIPPGGSVLLQWLFCPLEARSYHVELPIRYQDGSGGTLAISGRGYLLHRDSSPAAEGEGARDWQSWLGFSSTPAIRLPGHLVALNQDVVDLGTIFVEEDMRRLLVVTNISQGPVSLTFDLGHFASTSSSGISGALELTPPAVQLPPRGVQVCQLNFTAGRVPQMFESEIKLVVQQEVCLEFSPSSSAKPCQSGGVPGVCQGATQINLPVNGHCRPEQIARELDCEEEEEVIAQDPPRRRSFLSGSKLRSRLPIYLSMTESTCQKSPALMQQYQEACRDARGGGQEQGGGGLEAPVRGHQVVTLVVRGRVVTEQQVQAGSYVMSPGQLRELWQRLQWRKSAGPLVREQSQGVGVQCLDLYQHLPSVPGLLIDSTTSQAPPGSQDCPPGEGPEGGDELREEVVREVIEDMVQTVTHHSDTLEALTRLPPPSYPTLYGMRGLHVPGEQQDLMSVHSETEDQPVSDVSGPISKEVLKMVLDDFLVDVLQDQLILCHQQG